MVNVTPAIRHSGRRSEVPLRRRSAPPARHRADYRRFGRRIKQEVRAGSDLDVGRARLRRVGSWLHPAVALNEARNARVLLERAGREERPQR